MTASDTGISDETLMAYADGELDATAAAGIGAALRTDPALAARVEAHRALRARVQAAFAEELSEPVPQRLIDAALRSPASAAGAAGAAGARAGVVPLDAARARRTRSGWRPPLSLAAAASLVAGIVIGFLAWHRPEAMLRQSTDGTLVADGALAHALSEQLSGSAAPGGVDIGLSFLSKAGSYCRTFRTDGPGAPAGLACRSGSTWRIDLLAPGTAPAAAGGGYRMAASDLPAAVIDAVQARIVGAPLDRAAESAAREHDWEATSR